MKIPITKYGWPQVVVFPVSLLAVMLVLGVAVPLFVPLWLLISVETLLMVVFVWVLSFFRDPDRKIPLEADLLLSPADGRVTDVDIVDESDYIEGPAHRIGIFLSIFNVHINRAPCKVKVEKISYKKGRYKNAMSAQSAQVNESNDLAMLRLASPQDKLIVRQISGAIARRIVCAVQPGKELTSGEKFGMIKFGSRTELYLPVRQGVKMLVSPGDKVKAGLTPLVRYEQCQD